MFAKRRKVVSVGRSQYVALPPGTPAAEEGSMAADRLVLIDPEGELSPQELLDLLKQMEPAIWRRLARKTAKAEASC